MSRGTGSLTEDALEQILKTTDVADLLKVKKRNEDITEAQQAREQQASRLNVRALGSENEALDRIARRRRQGAVDRATAPTTTEVLEEFQKEVASIRQRRSLGSPPPKFTRGTPKGPATPELVLAQVVQDMLNEFKNIELPTEETTDA